MWEIPITYITSVNSRVVETAWMRKTQESITIRLSEANRQMEWLKVNFHHHGYYIVNYELSMWEYFQELLCNSFRVSMYWSINREKGACNESVEYMY